MAQNQQGQAAPVQHTQLEHLQMKYTGTGHSDTNKL